MLLPCRIIKMPKLHPAPNLWLSTIYIPNVLTVHPDSDIINHVNLIECTQKYAPFECSFQYIQLFVVLRPSNT